MPGLREIAFNALRTAAKSGTKLLQRRSKDCQRLHLWSSAYPAAVGADKLDCSSDTLRLALQFALGRSEVGEELDQETILVRACKA